MLIALKSEETDAFKAALVEQVRALAPQAMLHENIFKNYEQKMGDIFKGKVVEKLSESDIEASALKGRPAVAKIGGA